MKDADAIEDEPDRITHSLLLADQPAPAPVPAIGSAARTPPDKELSLLVANIIALTITAAVMTLLTFGLVTFFHIWSASPL